MGKGGQIDRPSSFDRQEKSDGWTKEDYQLKSDLPKGKRDKMQSK